MEISGVIHNYNVKEFDFTNHHLIIDDELYHCTKQSKLYIFLNKLTTVSTKYISTDVLYETADGDNITYIKYSPQVQEEKIKKLLSSIQRTVKIQNMNFDNYIKIQTSRFYTNGYEILNEEQMKKDYNDNLIYSKYRNFYSAVSHSSNIYGEKDPRYIESNNATIKEFAVKMQPVILKYTDEYIYKIVESHHKSFLTFEKEPIKPVLEFLRTQFGNYAFL